MGIYLGFFSEGILVLWELMASNYTHNCYSFTQRSKNLRVF